MMERFEDESLSDALFRWLSDLYDDMLRPYRMWVLRRAGLRWEAQLTRMEKLDLTAEIARVRAEVEEVQSYLDRKYAKYPSVQE